ncbi:tetratricopeptide (TPR) repeat protein [Rhizomicrobium palustre]|uniref:Tetratricopeptide (TPR) repeat protein n=1 Tax=Rhizomicrobium palustre TaxID=189966 RepID=A0A846MYN9_9PROT|nr:tetratricopeptide repeat protein [Rhizomicrobium palustre]NIK88077.1 tetratricopeptide (TPR) repeat protein [Rhizomicrobium palustre]
MAKFAPANTLNDLDDFNAKLDALSKLEALAEEFQHQKERRRSSRFVRSGVVAWRRGDIQAAGRAALRATEIDETNPTAFHLLAKYLERMGHTMKALLAFEKAYQLNPSSSDVLIDIGMTAFKLELHDAAMDMYRKYIAAEPNCALGYNNLAMAQADLDHVEEAIETLRGAIYRLPDQALLWNSLATVLAENGRAEESLVFYHEAIRLEPGSGSFRHNLGFAYQFLGQMSDALPTYDEAAKYCKDPIEVMEIEHSRAHCLLGLGRVEEGFKAYKVRRNERFRLYADVPIKAPYWQGEDVTGKRLLVIAEQGLGDEILFSNIVPDMLRLVGPTGKLQLAVDARLVTLFQRSFPEVEVGAYEDRAIRSEDLRQQWRFVPFAIQNGDPDYFVLLGCPHEWLRKTVDDFPGEAFLKPDPARVAEYRDILAKGGPGLTVGVCWRSMKLDTKRGKYYSSADEWAEIFKIPGVRIVNLQYGDCSEEIARAEKEFGIKIEVIDGLDLKDDLEGAAALSAALDLAISAPTASAAIAAGVGTETWILSACYAWPQLGTDHYPWYKNTRAFHPARFGDWKTLISDVAAELQKRVG